MEELTHELSRYRWSVLGLREVQWKNFGKTVRKDISFTSKAKRTDMKMVLVFMFTRTP